MLSHGKHERHVCQCGRSYKYKKGLSQHQRYECGKEPQFACPHCPYRAKQKVSLTTHLFCKHHITVQPSSLE
ncbi:hypothetical protein J6590_014793 [Homalodisca vitripennis]|nr:hypothetical protein J6590_014793 [Homalodisca vitripennis]